MLNLFNNEYFIEHAAMTDFVLFFISSVYLCVTEVTEHENIRFVFFFVYE